MEDLKSKLRKLSGEGVEGLEDCPPLYHIDLTHEDFMALLENPVSFTLSLGITVESVRINLSDKQWSPSERKFVARGGGSSELRKICCFIGGDGGYECKTWVPTS